MAMISPETSQIQVDDSIHNTDILNETQLLLRMLNSPQPTETSLATTNPDHSQIPNSLLQDAKITIILLFTAILANIVVIGMDIQKIFEDAGCSSGGEDQQTMKIPASHSVQHRDRPLAQHLPHEEDEGRVLGGVEAEQAALPGNPGPLRRSRTRNDLHLVDMNAGNQATLDWRGLAEAEFSAHRDGARSLRLRPQWDPRRQRAAFGGDT